MPNLWDDGGFEGNLALTSVGTPATSERSNTVAHSGTYSWKVVTDAAGEGISRALTTVSGTFYKLTAWVYVVTSGTVTLAGATAQAGAAISKATTAVNTWQRLVAVFRATGVTTTLQFTAGSGVTFYVDDVDMGALDAVGLTVTPASLANSTETSGLRVDGRDTATQPVENISATSGTLKWRMTPRHSAADVAKFGETTPYILDLYGDANNWLRLYWSAANTVTLDIKCVGLTTTQTWTATGAIVAGTTYACELDYNPTTITFKVDDVAKITNSAGGFTFGTLPANVYWGHKQDGSGQYDATFTSPL